MNSEIVDGETDCNVHSFTGKIICDSDQSGRMGDKVEHTLYLLTTDQVKARVIESGPEFDWRTFLEKIPQFYKYNSPIFLDLGKWKSRLINVGKYSWAEVFY